MTDAPGEQLALVRAGARRRSGAKRALRAADPLPVARVALDVSLAHLDRPFDYLVPAAQGSRCVPGCRVRARFAGALVDGYVLERAECSAHAGRLAYLDRVVSTEPVLAAEVAAVARQVADRYAGTLADVLRLAVPPRHAKVEGEPARPAVRVERPPAPGPWQAYPAGPAFLRAVAEGRAARAVWDALPGADWPRALATVAGTALAGGRGALLVVPDQRDLGRLEAALEAVVEAGAFTTLSADLGPAERYRRWLAVRRGAVRVVAGTRAAMFAPVAELGVVVCWDDGDDLHSEPRAPYPHVREVLCMRAREQGTAALVGGYARTTEATLLVRTGWAAAIRAERSTLRAWAPTIRAVGDDAELARDPAGSSARLPHLAWQTARDGLARGPVLVQTPRRGYVPGLACARCGATARCPWCAGPLAAGAADAEPACRWCGRSVTGWRCPSCSGVRLRAVVVGAARTAEELGRAFPGVRVRVSGGDSGVLSTVSAVPELVVATPGAEPVADGGYAAALLLDGWALLGRADLRAGEETVRRWANACALVRGRAKEGRVVVLADSRVREVQSLLRWDPAGFAERELDERTGLGLPPAVRAAAVSGDRGPVEDTTRASTLPETADVLGPVPVGTGDEPQVRALVRVPRRDGPALAQALHGVLAVRSAGKAAGRLRIQVDPLDTL